VRGRRPHCAGETLSRAAPAQQDAGAWFQNLIDMRSRLLSRTFAVAALGLSVTGLTACGESAEEKASKQVCSARNNISEEITKLQGLTISTNTLNEAKAGFETISNDLKKIKEAQPNLAPARKEQIETATKTFQSQLSTMAAGLASSLGSGSLSSALANAEPQLKAALTQLATDYKQALAPISCP